MNEDPNRVPAVADDLGTLKEAMQLVEVDDVPEAYRAGKAIVRRSWLADEVARYDLRREPLPEDLVARLNEQNEFLAQFGGTNSVFEATANQVPLMLQMGKNALAGAGVGGAIGTVFFPGAGTVGGAAIGGTFGAKVGMAASAFQVEAGNAYLDYREITDDKGRMLEPELAAGAALTYGVIAGALEMTGLRFMGAGWALLGGQTLRVVMQRHVRNLLQDQTARVAFRKIGAAYLKGIAGEATTEFLQKTDEDATAEITKLVSGKLGGAFEEYGALDAWETFNTPEAWQARGQEGKAGGLAAIGFGAGPAIVNSAQVTLSRNVIGNRTTREKLEKVEKLKASSKLNARSRKMFEEAIETVTSESRPILLDAKNLRDELQATGNLDAFLESTGIEAQTLDEAADLGDIVEVKFSEYAGRISGERFADVVARHAEFDAETLTTHQLEQIEQRYDAEVAKLPAEERTEYEALRDQFQEDLKPVYKEHARPLAKFLADMETGLSERAGLTTMQLFQGTRIERAQQQVDPRVRGVQFVSTTDPSAVGQVPDVVNVRGENFHRTPGYFRELSPREFLDLNPERDVSPETREFLSNVLESGGTFGAPFLEGELQDDGTVQITGHEGRARMQSLQEFAGEPRVPVAIFVRDKEGRPVDPETVRNAPLRSDPRRVSPAVTLYQTSLLTYDEQRLAEVAAEDAKYSNFQPPRTKAGKYLGLPEWVESPNQLRTLRRQINKLVQEGQVGRYWYERSAAKALALANGNMDDAHKLVGLMAIYSPRIDVWGNTMFAHRAYLHWQSGGAREDLNIRNNFAQSDDKAKAFLYDDAEWSGRKSDSFYRNLLSALLDQSPDHGRERWLTRWGLDESFFAEIRSPVTSDVWVFRAYGYDKPRAGGGKGSDRYSVTENELRRIAARLNKNLAPDEDPYLPRQIQAMLWTATQIRHDLARDVTNAAGFDSESVEHVRLWRKNALAIPGAKVEEALHTSIDFSDAFQGMTFTIPFETIPNNQKLGRYITNATPEEKAQYTMEMQTLLVDPDGTDTLTRLIGPDMSWVRNSLGGYEGKITPNVVTDVLPPKYKGDFTREHARLYTLAMQYIFSQDLGIYFRAYHKGTGLSQKARREFGLPSQVRAMKKAEAALVKARKEGTRAEVKAAREAVKEARANVEGLQDQQAFMVQFIDLSEATAQQIARALEKKFPNGWVGFTRMLDGNTLVITNPQPVENFTEGVEEVLRDYAGQIEYYADNLVAEGQAFWADWGNEGQEAQRLREEIRTLVQEDFGGVDPSAVLDWLDARRDDAQALDEAYRQGRAITPIQVLGHQHLKAPRIKAKHGTLAEEIVGNRLSLDYLLSGEGALAYGWGLYFTDRLQVARFYKRGGSAAGFGNTRGVRLQMGTSAGDVLESFETTFTEWLQTAKQIQNLVKDLRAEADTPAVVELVQEKLPGLQPNTIMRALDQRDVDDVERALQRMEARRRELTLQQIENIMDQPAPPGQLFGPSRAEAEEMVVLDPHDILAVVPVRGSGNLWTDVSDILKLYGFSDLESKLFTAAQGQVLEVEIPGADDLLWWDSTLDEMPETVRTRFLKSDAAHLVDQHLLSSARAGQLDPRSAFFTDGIVTRLGRITGERIYNILVNLGEQHGETGNGAKRFASMLLNEAGIPGHRYLDQMSRGEGEGTYNYVIWDEHVVEITQRLESPRKAEVELRPGRAALVRLGGSADVSSMLHESAHLYFDALARVAHRTPELTADLGAVKRWLTDNTRSLMEWIEQAAADPRYQSVTEEHLAAVREAGGEEFLARQIEAGEIGGGGSLEVDAAARAMHEYMARGAEAYFYEGHAPTRGTESMMRRFARELRSTYRSIDELGVALNDEIRGVFDRMIAVDDEIRLAESEANLGGSEAMRQQLEMTEAEVAQHQRLIDAARDAGREKVLAQRLKQEKRKLQERTEERRAEIEEEVTKELMQDPRYQADAFLRRGVQFEFREGRIQPSEQRATVHKLGRNQVLEDYSKRDLARLPTGRYGYVRAGDGLHPDEVRDLFGIEGDLVEALAGLEPLSAAVSRETEARLRARYGDPQEEALASAEEALAAGDERTALLEYEWAQLRRRRSPLREAAGRQVAEEGAAPIASLRAALGAAQDALREAREAGDEPRVRSALVGVEIAQGRLDAARQEGRSVAARRRSQQSVERAIRAQSRAIARVAQDRISKLRVRDIGTFEDQGRVRRHRAAEEAARRDVERAYLERDWDAAEEAHQRRLFHAHSYRAAVQAKQEAETIRARAKRLTKPAAQRRLGKVPGDYLERVNQLLSAFDFRKRSLRAIDQEQAFVQWVQEQEAAGFNVDGIDPRVLENAGKKNWKDMTLTELRGLDESLKNVTKLASLKQKLLTAQGDRDFDTAMDEIDALIRSENTERPVSARMFKTRWDVTKGGLKKADSYLVKVEQLIEWLGGEDIGNLLRQALWQPLAEAQYEEQRMQRQITTRLKEIVDGLGYRRANTRYSALGAEWTVREIMSVALNMGNESNLQKMKKGASYDQRFNREWTDEDIHEIVKHLTNDEWRMVQEIWDLIDTLFPAMAKVHRRTTGNVVEKIERRPFTSPTGRAMDGGYFPVVYDPEQSVRQEANLFESHGPLDGRVNWIKPATNQGASMERVESYARPLWFDLNAIPSHISQVVHDITHREAINNALRIVQDARFRSAVTDTLGKEYVDILIPWLNGIARATPHDRAMPAVDRWMRKLRINTSIMAMGFKATTATSQLAGFTQSIPIVGIKPLRQAVAQVLWQDGPAASYRSVVEKSEEMKGRFDTINQNVREGLSRIQGQQTTLARAQELGFHWIGWGDMMVSLPTWVAGYNNALAAGKSEALAIQEGDRAVRLSQGSGALKDLALVQNSGEALKLFVNFYSYFSVLYNRQRNAGRMTRRAVAEGSAVTLAQAIAQWFWLVPASAVMGEILAGRGPGPEDDLDDEPGIGYWDFANWTWKVSWDYPFQAFPVVRDVATSISKGFSYTISPQFGLFQEIVWTAQAADDLMAGDPELKFTKHAARFTGYAFGIPGINQAIITGGNIWDVIDGELQPESVLDWLDLLAFRQQEGETR